MNAQLAGFRALPLAIAQLSLPAVLKCGQSFRWQSIPIPSETVGSSTSPHASTDHEWRLTLQDRVICLRQTPTTLFYRTVFPESASLTEPGDHEDAKTLTWIRDYFQLDIDLEHLYKDWSGRDSVFNGIKDRFSGIRILRQDPWENLVSLVQVFVHCFTHY